MAAQGQSAYPAEGAAWASVALLFLVYACSFVDRQIMSLLVAPIRADLQISDTELSLLHGFAFALLYSVLGLPIGRWVDSGDRRVILALGVAVWSAFTIACAGARNFATLFAARVGVGVGEATVAPATYSLIADYFPAERRGVPMGVFGAGVYVGIGAALVVGALVVRALAGAPTIDLGLIGPIAAWQAAFIIVGAPGLLLALAALTLLEPRSKLARSSEQRRDASDKRPWPIVALCLHHGATACLAMALYALIAWAPEYLRRSFALPVAQSGFVLGLVIASSGVAGVIIAGVVADYWRRRGVLAAPMWVMGAASIGAALSGFLFATAATPEQAYIWAGVSIFFLAVLTNCGPAGVQELHPARRRGVGAAIFQFTVTLIGLGVGPTIPAVLTDYVFANESRLADALAVGLPLMCATAAAAAFIGVKSYRRAAAMASA